MDGKNNQERFCLVILIFRIYTLKGTVALNNLASDNLNNLKVTRFTRGGDEITRGYGGYVKSFTIGMTR
jgi:hypothetical protein